MRYKATKRKKLFRERVTHGLDVTELRKPTRGTIWAYQTPDGIKHLWLHFDTNYEWWKVCSRPQSNDRFKRPVLHGFLGPKKEQWHMIPHKELIDKFHLNYAEDQIQIHRKAQLDLFDEYQDIASIIKYRG